MEVEEINHLQIDSVAKSALDLFSKNAKSENSCLGVLSKSCSSKLGVRCVKEWLTFPLLSKSEIEQRQTVVEFFIKEVDVSDQLESALHVPDVEKSIKRLEKSKADLADIVSMYQFTNGIPSIVSSFASCAGGEYEEALRTMFLDELIAKIDDFANYQSMVEKTIDLDRAAMGQYFFKPSFDDALRELDEERTRLLSEIEQIHEQVKKQPWVKGRIEVKLEADKVRGYVFKVPKSADRACRAYPGNSVCATLVSGCLFNTARMRELCSDMKDIDAQYTVRQKSLAEKVLEIAKTYIQVFSEASNLVGVIDALRSFAQAASQAPEPYCKPTILPPESGMMLKDARHPIMELQNAVSFISNDYELVPGESTFCIVTGPNMAGKSTYLRTLALCVIFAQIGSFVPASSAEMSVVHHIFTRVGATDSLSKAESTFMSEMVEVGHLLNTVGSNGLVLIDELGRGTSTFDGFGLAWSISEQLIAKKCLCLFATHYHELTELEKQHEGVVNKHATAIDENGSITMLHKVESGAAPASFGISVAEMAGFPPSVLESAREELAHLNAIANGEVEEDMDTNLEDDNILEIMASLGDGDIMKAKQMLSQHI